MPAAPPKGSAAKAKKAKAASVDLPPTPSPLATLLRAHRSIVPATLSAWKQRCDLLHLDLHLTHAPYLTLTFLLATSSPLSCLLQRLQAVHGPFSGLRLYRSSEESEDDELTDLSLTLLELGCRGGAAAGDEQRTGESSSADAVTGVARRRYELWYTLLSALDGALLMREPRHQPGDEQRSDGQRGEGDGEDEDAAATRACPVPSIVITADESAGSGGALRTALERLTARARMGRVVDVALDQHASRQRVERSKEAVSAAFDVNAQSQQPPSPTQPRRSASPAHAQRAPADREAAEETEQPTAAALSLALSYS